MVQEKRGVLRLYLFHLEVDISLDAIGEEDGLLGIAGCIAV